MNLVKKFSALIVLCFILVLTACAGEEQVNQQEEPADNQTNEISAFPVILNDAANQEVTIDSEPSQIISLIPSNTEIAYALGLGEKIVGVSDWANYPEEVQEVEKIGGMEFNVEKVISLQPDLVLAHASSMVSTESALQQLRDAGLTVLVVNDATSFDETYQSILMIADATGTTEKAEVIIDEMKIKLQSIKEKAALIDDEERLKVWVEVSPSPEIYTAASGTFIDEMLQVIGAENAAAEQSGWVSYTEEDAILLAPDVIITTYGYYVENPKDEVLSRPAWKDVPAVQNERVYDVHSDKVTRPGPRLIEGVEDLAKSIYPEIYQD